MKWINAHKELVLNNKNECPICKSSHLKFKYDFVGFYSNRNMGFITIWCEECRNGGRISRIPGEPQSDEIEVPKDIKYTNQFIY